MRQSEVDKWEEAHLVLGGSWYQRDAHEDLGSGADYEKIIETMAAMKRAMIKKGISIDHLPDFLQSTVSQFDMPFHEFLRFEKSQSLLSDAMDQVIRDNDFRPENQQSGPIASFG